MIYDVFYQKCDKMNIMRVIITGGIATGKSTACKIFEEFGYSIIDADKIAHIELEKAKEIILHKFGTIDRKKLGNIIFNDKDKRRELESILHPRIKEAIEQKEAILKQKDIRHIIDIPLFFESNRYKADKVIVVYAPKILQLRRLLKRDKLTENEAIKRVDTQMDIEKKRALADIVIDNTKDLKHLRDEVKNAIFKI